MNIASNAITQIGSERNLTGELIMIKVAPSSSSTTSFLGFIEMMSRLTTAHDIPIEDMDKEKYIYFNMSSSNPYRTIIDMGKIIYYGDYNGSHPSNPTIPKITFYVCSNRVVTCTYAFGTIN